MGIVYEATQLSLDRVVALKVVAPGLSGRPRGFRARFRARGRCRRARPSPHRAGLRGRRARGAPVPCHAAGARSDAEGVDHRARAGPAPVAADPARRRRRARHRARSGLIHRDIKPSNVLVGRRDQAFLCDFGLTKEGGSVTASLTKTGHVVGTLDYIAPEQIRGGEASTASDVYAFAAVLYETLTGQVPFPRSTEAALLYAHISDPGRERQKSAARPAGGAGRGDRGSGSRSSRASARSRRWTSFERAEEILAGTTAGVRRFPRAGAGAASPSPTPRRCRPRRRRPRSSRRSPIIRPRSPRPRPRPTSSSHRRRSPGETETDVDLPAPAPAALTETDVEFMAPPPEPPQTASTETLVPTPEPVRPTVTDTKVATPEPAVTPADRQLASRCSTGRPVRRATLVRAGASGRCGRSRSSWVVAAGAAGAADGGRK